MLRFTFTPPSLRLFSIPSRLKSAKTRIAKQYDRLPGRSNKLRQEQVYKLDTYIDRLMEQNKVMNLTAIHTREEAWGRHVLDSMALLPVMETCLQGEAKSARIVDVGSGAGLPGIVIAIARPDWQVLLLDSIQKRCRFVNDAVKQLHLNNVKVLWSRAENAGRHENSREGFDVAIVRAVAEMRTLVELSLPLVKVGGHLVAAKGPDPQIEVDAAALAITKLGGSLVGIQTVDSFGPLGQRTAVVVEKIRPTPMTYPRDNGLPKKKPL